MTRQIVSCSLLSPSCAYSSTVLRGWSPGSSSPSSRLLWINRVPWPKFTGSMQIRGLSSSVISLRAGKTWGTSASRDWSRKTTAIHCSHHKNLPNLSSCSLVRMLPKTATSRWGSLGCSTRSMRKTSNSTWTASTSTVSFSTFMMWISVMWIPHANSSPC